MAQELIHSQVYLTNERDRILWNGSASDGEIPPSELGEIIVQEAPPNAMGN